jgi:hypothetical protein
MFGRYWIIGRVMLRWHGPDGPVWGQMREFGDVAATSASTPTATGKADIERL